MLYTTASVCHALYLQSSLLSSTSLAYSSSLQKKHQLRCATHHHPSTCNTILAFTTIHHQRAISRISNRRYNKILNSGLNNNNELQQIDNDESEEHLVGIGVGIDLGTTNSAIAMMIPSTTDSDDIDGSRYVR